MAGAATADNSHRSYRGNSRHSEMRVDDRYQPQPQLPVTRLRLQHAAAWLRELHYRGSPYYYRGGAWYRPYGPRYVVVAPPIGIGVSFLPPFYTTVWFGGSPYYYADQTYYAWRPERREYVVTQPPRSNRTGRTIPAATRSSCTRRTDRARSSSRRIATNATPGPCSRAASIPRARAAVSRDSEIESKRADYRRAEGACLEGRGYSVK